MQPNTHPRLAHQNVRDILESFFERRNAESFPWTLKGPERVEIAVAFPLYKAARDECLCGHVTHAHHHSSRTCGKCDCFAFHSTIYMVGKLDIWGNERRSDEDVPVDTKTTARIDQRFLQQFQLDSQLTGYMWLLSQYAKKAIHRAYINAIELSQLPGASAYRKCATHGVPYNECWGQHAARCPTHKLPREECLTEHKLKCDEHNTDTEECRLQHAKFQVVGPIERSDQQIEEWKQDAIHLALTYHDLLSYNLKDLHRVRTQGKFNGGCGYCEFRELCLMDRDHKQVEKMFTIQPWSPWDAAFEGHKGQRRDPDGFYVDNSILKAVATCDTQVFLRYGKGYTSPEQSGPLGAGIAVHLAMEVWMKGGSAKDALAAFDEVYGEHE